MDIWGFGFDLLSDFWSGFCLFSDLVEFFWNGYDLICDFWSGFWLFSDLVEFFWDGFCRILMGKQESARKWRNEIKGLEQRGPLPKAKSKSLKLASQAIKKAVKPPRWKEVSLRGRAKKRRTIGIMAKNLVKPLEVRLAMV